MKLFTILNGILSNENCGTPTNEIVGTYKNENNEFLLFKNNGLLYKIKDKKATPYAYGTSKGRNGSTGLKIVLYYSKNKDENEAAYFTRGKDDELNFENQIYIRTNEKMNFESFQGKRCDMKDCPFPNLFVCKTFGDEYHPRKSCQFIQNEPFCLPFGMNP